MVISLDGSDSYLFSALVLSGLISPSFHLLPCALVADDMVLLLGRRAVDHLVYGVPGSDLKEATRLISAKTHSST